MFDDPYTPVFTSTQRSARYKSNFYNCNQRDVKLNEWTTDSMGTAITPYTDIFIKNDIFFNLLANITEAITTSSQESYQLKNKYRTIINIMYYTIINIKI